MYILRHAAHCFARRTAPSNMKELTGFRRRGGGGGLMLVVEGAAGHQSRGVLDLAQPSPPRQQQSRRS